MKSPQLFFILIIFLCCFPKAQKITWENTTLRTIAILFLTIDSSDNILAKTPLPGFFISQDQGKSWHLYGLNAQFFAFNSKQSIFAGNSAAVFRSVDKGKTWARILPLSMGIPHIAINDKDEIFVLTSAKGQSHLYFSKDNGANWVATSKKPGDHLGLVTGKDNRVFFGVAHNQEILIYRSLDNGKSWNSAKFPASLNTLTISSYGHVFAGTGNGIYHSADGKIWRKIHTPFKSTRTMIATSNGYILAGTERINGKDPFAKVYYSKDNGTNWHQLGGVLKGVIQNMAISSKGFIYLGILSLRDNKGRLLRSNINIYQANR